jgi:methylamine---glutamate N-methyltransferase subunit A
MCGIVGLFLKDATFEKELGVLAAPMLVSLSDRGPDSTGFAVYGAATPDHMKLTLRGSAATDFDEIAEGLGRAISAAVAVTRRDTHAVLAVPSARAALAAAELATIAPEIAVVGTGERMEIYKEVGSPAAVTARFDLGGMSGTHAIGHTRMATESAVTTDGAHPFSTGEDQCLVHNGSLSNHNGVRRYLQRGGVTFRTENDTEVAAGYMTWRMRQGLSLEAALQNALDDLDGFFTFVVATARGFAVLRDPIACKPAVMVETEAYVAFGTEYRALADLPGVARGHVFEPAPAKVYVWERRV